MLTGYPGVNNQTNDPSHTGHYMTLKSWRKSSELSRATIKQTLTATESVPERANLYQVRLKGAQNWNFYATPPRNGAEEWVYFDAKGMPSLYWNHGASGLVVLG